MIRFQAVKRSLFQNFISSNSLIIDKKKQKKND